jgi:NAD(P)-dependent dehydrogenase (short-subunit alcohol dehydrogenase family)
MPTLHSFPDGFDAVVIGASGGIGAAMTRHLAACDRVRRVFALSRSQPHSLPQEAIHGEIDICDERSVASAAAGLPEDASLGIVIVASGILHHGKAIQPEKTIGQLSADAMKGVLEVNTVGPAMVARYFLPRLAADGKSVFAVLSARVGSISDNRLGGWISYRASKAAVNMVVKTLAIEQARRRPQSIVVSLHPGTVDTALSSPFTRRSSPSTLFLPEQSARYLLNVIDDLRPDDSGGFFAWDRSRIEY